MGGENRFSNYSSYYNNYCNSSSSSSAGAEGGGGGEAAVMRMRRTRKKKEGEGGKKLPAWLEGLMGETFFGSCGVHEERRKNEKNVFCLLCCHSICPHCLPAAHHSHPFLQVRRYVYHDVVRLGDLERLIDCSYIQPYTINSAKVIFVKERPQSRSGGSGKAASASNICSTCDRVLQHPFHFCSLSCKVNHMVAEGEELGSILVMGAGGAVGSMNQVADNAAASTEDMAFSQFEGLRMDSSEITDDDELGGGGGGGQPQLFITASNNYSSNSMAEITDPSFVTNHDDHYQRYYPIRESDPSSGPDQLLGPQRQILRKKKKHGPSGGFLQAGINALSFGSRRKGAPHRAPLS